MYCTYITMYTGDKFPKWYIGSSSVKNIEKGYVGSVSSKKYKELWLSEVKENHSLFNTRILSRYQCRTEALKEELRLHVKHNVHINNKYVNMSLACPNGFFGVSMLGPSSPSYGKTMLRESILKRLRSMNTPNKEGTTPLQVVSTKVRATLSSPEWKEKYGNSQVAGRKIVGEDGLNYYQRMSKKGLEVLLSEEWKNTKGSDAIEKQKATRNSIQENGKSFQYNVAQKSKETRIKNSPHYNVYDNLDNLLEQNVSRKFVREVYTNTLRFKTKGNPLASNNSRFKGYYCEVVV